MAEQVLMDFIKPKEILISLKPNFLDLIITHKKTYEFRKFCVAEPVRNFWVYVTKPTAKLAYRFAIGPCSKYPLKIPENGIGNKEFNNGLKQSKYAYPIIHVDKMNNGISLYQLKREYNFFPPQNFIYLDNFPKLMNKLKSNDFERIF